MNIKKFIIRELLLKNIKPRREHFNLWFSMENDCSSNAIKAGTENISREKANRFRK